MLLPVIRVVAATLAPSGGQLRARRNAWSAMSEGAVRARARREADAAMHAAALRIDVVGTRAARSSPGV